MNKNECRNATAMTNAIVKLLIFGKIVSVELSICQLRANLKSDDCLTFGQLEQGQV